MLNSRFPKACPARSCFSVAPMRAATTMSTSSLLQGFHQLWRLRGIIGIVAVDHDINVGFDLGEHPPHHVALSGAGFVTDQCSGLAGDFCRIIS